MDNSQKKKLTSAAIIVMSSIILSRVTGYLRVVFISKKIGVNAVSDAYFTAFILPDLMFNLLVGGAISAALIPVLSGYIGKKAGEGWLGGRRFIY